jgi:uncharacterized membrane protein YiaA
MQQNNNLSNNKIKTKKKLKEQIADTNWASRKLVVCLIVEILTIILLLTGYITANIWANVTKWNVFLYMFGNASSKFANNFRGL